MRYRVLHGDRTLPFIRWCYIFWNQSYVLSIVLSMLYQPMISKLTFDLSKGLLITKKVRKFRMFTFWVAGAWNIYCDVRFHVRELEIFPDVNKLRRYYNNIDFDFDIVVIRTKKDFDSGLKDDRSVVMLVSMISNLRTTLALPVSRTFSTWRQMRPRRPAVLDER